MIIKISFKSNQFNRIFAAKEKWKDGEFGGGGVDLSNMCFGYGLCACVDLGLECGVCVLI